MHLKKVDNHFHRDNDDVFYHLYDADGFRIVSPSLDFEAILASASYRAIQESLACVSEFFGWTVGGFYLEIRACFKQQQEIPEIILL